MNTVGVFAGRGDVVLGMAFAAAFSIIIGWYLRGAKDRLVAAWRRKFPRKQV